MPTQSYRSDWHYFCICRRPAVFLMRGIDSDGNPIRGNGWACCEIGTHVKRAMYAELMKDGVVKLTVIPLGSPKL